MSSDFDIGVHVGGPKNFGLHEWINGQKKTDGKDIAAGAQAGGSQRRKSPADI